MEVSFSPDKILEAIESIFVIVVAQDCYLSWLLFCCQSLLDVCSDACRVSGTTKDAVFKISITIQALAQEAKLTEAARSITKNLVYLCFRWRKEMEPNWDKPPLAWPWTWPILSNLSEISGKEIPALHLKQKRTRNWLPPGCFTIILFFFRFTNSSAGPRGPPRFCWFVQAPDGNPTEVIPVNLPGVGPPISPGPGICNGAQGRLHAGHTKINTEMDKRVKLDVNRTLVRRNF